MKLRKPTAFVALALGCILLFSGCLAQNQSSSSLPGADASGTGQESPASVDRRTIPYSQMKYARPDVPALLQQLAALTEELKTAGDFQAAKEADIAFANLVEDYNTQSVLATIGSMHDVNDSFYQGETAYFASVDVDVTEAINTFNKLIVEGDFAEDFKDYYGDYTFESIETSLLFSGESVKEFQRERAQLTVDYYTMMSTLAVEYNGASYTYYDLFELDSLSLYDQLLGEYFDLHMDDYVQLYARMVELDKETAYELGFADAATMYYLWYERDYSPSDARAILENIKSTIVPLMPAVVQYDYEIDGLVLEDSFAAMAEALPALGSTFREGWDFMTEYELHDMEGSDSKPYGIAFTDYLASYDTPFLFGNWEGDFFSAGTLIHEFGHFYADWCQTGRSGGSNLDMAETYSQGLELLMMEQYGLFTEYPGQFEQWTLQNTAYNSLISQSAYEEFQLRIYELETFDKTVLGRTFAEVLGEYGYDLTEATDEYGAIHYWIEIQHLFESPFYTMSYVSSGITALQLWGASLEDWDGAVQTYQALIDLDQDQPYTALLQQAGLKAPGDDGVLNEIAAHYEDIFGSAPLTSEDASVDGEAEEDASSLPGEDLDEEDSGEDGQPTAA